jgi:hypothetical protein
MEFILFENLWFRARKFVPLRTIWSDMFADPATHSATCTLLARANHCDYTTRGIIDSSNDAPCKISSTPDWSPKAQSADGKSGVAKDGCAWRVRLLGWDTLSNITLSLFILVDKLYYLSVRCTYGFLFSWALMSWSIHWGGLGGMSSEQVLCPARLGLAAELHFPASKYHWWCHFTYWYPSPQSRLD